MHTQGKIHQSTGSRKKQKKGGKTTTNDRESRERNEQRNNAGGQASNTYVSQEREKLQITSLRKTKTRRKERKKRLKDNNKCSKTTWQIIYRLAT